MKRGIYKRGNVYWIRYAGLDGKTLYESSGSHRQKDAEILLLDRKKTISDGKQPEIIKIDNHTFLELAKKYIEWMVGRQKSAQVKGYIIGQLKGVFGALPLRRFNMLAVEQLQTNMIAKGLKPASINKTLNILKHMFTKATEWEMVESEVSKRVHKVHLLKDEGKRLRYLSKEECQTLVDKCVSHLMPIVITALNTGMRKGEILGLVWKNVDLKHGFIILDNTKNGERREIPINATLREVLHRTPRRIEEQGDENPYVFIDKYGKPYKDIKRSFSSALRRAGIKDFHFHDLRHTFASQLVMAGIDITTIKELLGHKSLTMTLRYAHLAPAHKVKALDLLNKILNEKSTIQKLYSSKEKDLRKDRKSLKRLVGDAGIEPATSSV